MKKLLMLRGGAGGPFHLVCLRELIIPRVPVDDDIYGAKAGDLGGRGVVEVCVRHRRMKPRK